MINVAGVVVFLASGRVAWVHAVILAAAAYAGATIGVRFARRLSPDVLRYTVVLLGLGVAIGLIATE